MISPFLFFSLLQDRGLAKIIPAVNHSVAAPRNSSPLGARRPAALHPKRVRRSRHNRPTRELRTTTGRLPHAHTPATPGADSRAPVRPKAPTNLCRKESREEEQPEIDRLRG